MKYAAEMGSGALICIASFIKTGSGIQKLIGGYKDALRAEQSHKPHLLFQNNESRLKIW
jgi:hypothetical protein